MRLVRYVIPALASLCLVSQPLSAQGGATGTVHGQVTDSVTKQGLPSATISIVGTTRVTHTGPDGNYSLADVPAGTAVVRVTLIGYAPQQQSITVTPAGTAEVPFGLAPQASLLEPVVVTGYRSEEHTSELQSRENLVCRLLLEKKKPDKIVDFLTHLLELKARCG